MFPDRLTYPEKARIQEVEKLLPDSTYTPAPPISDRNFWCRLFELKSGKAVISKAVRINNRPIIMLTDNQYLVFSKTGSRTLCDRVRRRSNFSLKNLVLAECLENLGRFLEKIEEYIEAYLNMRTWVGPPHDTRLNQFHGRAIGVDIMAVTTSCLLASTYSLLESKLSESLKKRMKVEFERRIINPYLSACRTGKTEDVAWWLTIKNNWNAVCNFGVVYTTLVMSDSAKARAEVVTCALESLKYFLMGFTPDGYCTEGIGYWSYGFGNFLLLGEVLNRYTDRKIDIFDSPKVKKIAGFAVDFELCNDKYPAYSDNPMAVRVGTYARLAVARNFNIPLTTSKPDRFSGLIEQILMNISSTEKVGRGKKSVELRSWFKDSGILICRSKSAKNTFYASIKAGHNDEFHNHNDIGSYAVFINDIMPLSDPGKEEYSWRTFSEQRYESLLLNSWGHPVPVVGGKLQSTGRQFEGKILKRSFSDEKDSILIDLKGAYELDSLKKLEREFVFDRMTNTIMISDFVKFSQPETFETALVTCEHFKMVSPNEIHIFNGKTNVAVNIMPSNDSIKITPEIIEENNVGHNKPCRIGIDFSVPVKKASVKLLISNIVIE